MDLSGNHDPEGSHAYENKNARDENHASFPIVCTILPRLTQVCKSGQSERTMPSKKSGSPLNDIFSTHHAGIPKPSICRPFFNSLQIWNFLTVSSP
jgi:hypothetical protein